MEYFNQTNSSRAVDVLVKVKDPHDTHIFDKLLDWVNGPNKNQAITLFGFIVEKHPSWLHKVANHQLLKDVLKLLKVNPFRMYYDRHIRQKFRIFSRNKT